MPVSLDRQLTRVVAEARAAGAPARYLNLGSGRDRREGFVNVDIADLPEVDVVAALGDEPLPFPSDEFGVILCRDILEHVEVVPSLREIDRVLAPGGLVLISAVHFTSRNLYSDPTHIRGFSARTFDFSSKGPPPRTARTTSTSPSARSSSPRSSSAPCSAGAAGCSGTVWSSRW